MGCRTVHQSLLSASRNALLPAVFLAHFLLFSFVITAKRAQRSGVAVKVTWNRTGSGKMPCHSK